MSNDGSQPLADGSRGSVPENKTPGYSPGGVLNPARVSTPNAPFHMSPQASGIFGSMVDYMDNSGAHRAGNQTQELFGEAAANRVIITPEGLRNLFESHQSIDEMKEVFIHQLEDTSGIIEEIRAANNETFTDTVLVNQVVRQLSDNIVARLPQVCADLLEGAVQEVFDVLAPRLCSHFDLMLKVPDTPSKSPAMEVLIEKWTTLAPLYVNLENTKIQIVDSRNQLSKTIRLLQQLEHGLLQSASAAEEDWTFLDSSWSSEQFNIVSQNMHAASADARFAKVPLLDIITGNSRYSID